MALWWRSADGVNYCDVGSDQLLVVPMGCHIVCFANDVRRYWVLGTMRSGLMAVTIGD